ncbi:hypothetical protein K504DRAFT_498357 [Pleomassaria siparia CBS 279.74]|uniref:RING-type domain-containing protein n=1 Tax=Pleomassaria siparia CBS 279.74 TaxID=1314801 RepID=A0A6G1KL73_9PLEO|nr:hypothetical protein K504DRAFT_498357 [Pleomassaria siparia CBS 279.74]
MANNRAFNESHSNTELVTMNVRAEEAGTGSGHGHDNLALAVILPALFAIVLIVLVGISPNVKVMMYGTLLIYGGLGQCNSDAQTRRRRHSRVERREEKKEIGEIGSELQGAGLGCLGQESTKDTPGGIFYCRARVVVSVTLVPSPLFVTLFQGVQMVNGLHAHNSVICLDEFEDAAQIRGLGCLHVFHQECLDDWFGRWNEYCPLCHRPIIQGLKGKSERAMGRRGLRVAVPGAGFLV